MTDKTATEPQIHFPTVAAEYNASESQKDRLQREIDGLEWHAFVPGQKLTAPFMQGHALRSIIREYAGKPRQVAWNGALGPCGFYGIERSYPNGQARNYYVDDGLSVTCVRSDFWPS